MALINFYAAARAAAGAPSLKIPAGSMEALIDQLAASSPELAKLLPTCSYLLNGESCENLNQLLVEGDQVDVLPQFAGG